VSQLLYVDTKTYLVDDILTKVDRMSMLNSLEYAFRSWTTFLSSGPPGSDRSGSCAREQKYILRKLAERIGVPRETLYRKSGIFAPLVHWMRHELKDMLMILLEPRTLERGYFQPSGIRTVMDDYLLRGRANTGGSGGC